MDSVTSSSPLWHKIKRYFGLYDRTIFVCTIVAGIVLLAHIVLMAVFLVPRLGRLDFLRLHYTASLGIDWVGEWWNITVYPVVGFAMFVANGYFTGRLALQHRLLGLVMAVMTLLLECAVGIAGVLAIGLNT